MYNAGIEKAIPATLPHTPSCKVRNEGIILPIHGPLRRRPHHWLPNAVAIRLHAELNHAVAKLIMTNLHVAPMQAA